MHTLVLIALPDWTPPVPDGYTLLRCDAGAGYVARLVDARAAFVLVDARAAVDGKDWRFWVTTPKTSPATRRIPIALVSDDAAVRAQALDAGADFALAPDEVPAALPRLLAEHGRVPDAAAQDTLACQCGEAMPPEGVESLRLFNAGDYYGQHDAFEALWMQEPGPVRDLYRAVLQVGVAYYQVTRGNYRGAHKMLLRAVQWLALLPDTCRGVDVAQLRADADAVRVALERVAQGAGETVDPALLKPVKFTGR